MTPPTKPTTLSNDAYAVHFCPVHKKHIHFLKTKQAEGRCWDCLRDAAAKAVAGRRSA